MHEFGQLIFADMLLVDVVVDQKEPQLCDEQFYFELIVLLMQFLEVSEIVNDVLEVLEVDLILFLQMFVVELVELLFQFLDEYDVRVGSYFRF